MAAVAHLYRPGLLRNGQLRLPHIGALLAGAAHHRGRSEDAADCACLHSSGDILKYSELLAFVENIILMTRLPLALINRNRTEVATSTLVGIKYGDFFAGHHFRVLSWST